jgi:hypothetical protein
MKHPFMTAMTLAAGTLVGSALVAGAQENYPTKPITLRRRASCQITTK